MGGGPRNVAFSGIEKEIKNKLSTLIWQIRCEGARGFNCAFFMWSTKNLSLTFLHEGVTAITIDKNITIVLGNLRMLRIS